MTVKLFCAAVFCMASFILFLPTAVLLIVGMLPTLVSAFVDREPGKNKTFTIGAMNFAGCFPYLLALWVEFNNIETTLLLLAEPKTIIVMFGAAGLGYLINDLITLGVSNILVQRSKQRIKKIELEKEALEERWGVAVNGNFVLDEYGFPIEEDHDRAKN